MNVSRTISRILRVILCFTPFLIAPYTSDGIGFPKTIFIIAMTLLIVGIWVLYEKDKGRQIRSMNFVLKSAILYLILIYTSTIFSIDILNSIFGITNRGESVLLQSCYVLLFLFSTQYLKFDRKTINALIISGVVMSTIGVLQFFKVIYVESYSFPWGDFASPFGTLSNPNYLGAYLTIILPISIYMYFSNKSWKYYFSSCLIFAVALMSRTRGAWLGMSIAMVILIVFFVRDSKKRKKVEVLIMTFASIIFALNLLMNGIIISRVLSIIFDFKQVAAPAGPAGSPGPDDAAGSYRIFTWKRVVMAIPRNPLVGVGMGNLRYIFETYFSNDLVVVREQGVAAFQRAHNEFIHIAATTGIPSLIVYIAFLFGVAKNSISRIRSNPISIALTASIIGYIAQSFFSNNIVYHSYMFWIILGTSMYRGKTVDDADDPISNEN